MKAACEKKNPSAETMVSQAYLQRASARYGGMTREELIAQLARLEELTKNAHDHDKEYPIERALRLSRDWHDTLNCWGMRDRRDEVENAGHALQLAVAIHPDDNNAEAHDASMGFLDLLGAKLIEWARLDLLGAKLIELAREDKNKDKAERP